MAKYVYVVVPEPEPCALAEAKQLRAILRQAVESLEPDFKKVLQALYGLDGLDMSEKELAAEMGVSESRIRELETEALEALRRQPYRIQLIRDAAGI